PAAGTWHIEFNEVSVHAPDLKGYWQLRELIARPHQFVTALALMGSSINEAISTADTGPILDAEALRAYRKRLAELDDELDAAALRGDSKTQAERSVERDAVI